MLQKLERALSWIPGFVMFWPFYITLIKTSFYFGATRSRLCFFDTKKLQHFNKKILQQVYLKKKSIDLKVSQSNDYSFLRRKRKYFTRSRNSFSWSISCPLIDWTMNSRVTFICKILEILKGLSISLKFWLKIFGKLVSDLL